MESNNNKKDRGLNSQQDRRRFIRLSLEPPLEVGFRLVPSISKHENKALIKNISVGGGLLVELLLKNKEEEDRLLTGKEKICFETGVLEMLPQIKILGKVVWLKKMDKGGLFYEAGVSFENIDEKIQEDLLHAMIDLAFRQKNLKA